MSMAAGEAELTARLPDLAPAVAPGRVAATAEFIEILAPYVAGGYYAVEGDLTLNHLLLGSDPGYKPVGSEDLLAVTVAGIGTVDPALTHEFLVAHHHVMVDEKVFYLHLVHEPTKTSAEMTPAIEGAGVLLTRLLNVRVPLSTPEAMLVDRVWRLQSVLGDIAVASSLYTDALDLRPVARRDERERLWGTLQVPGGMSLAQTLQESREAITDNPRLLVPPALKLVPPAGTDCPQCLKSAHRTGDMPPTDNPQKVYEIWRAA
ncbi:MAG TPA: hypothetical protein VLG47_05360 [Candidatus Saccharimonadales bacterium]|nr:hypothetical protein [Candidatus Saccharimonadales bacterium]